MKLKFTHQPIGNVFDFSTFEFKYDECDHIAITVNIENSFKWKLSCVVSEDTYFNTLCEDWGSGIDQFNSKFPNFKQTCIREICSFRQFKHYKVFTDKLVQSLPMYLRTRHLKDQLDVLKLYFDSTPNSVEYKLTQCHFNNDTTVKPRSYSF